MSKNCSRTTGDEFNTKITKIATNFVRKQLNTKDQNINKRLHKSKTRHLKTPMDRLFFNKDKKL